MEGETQTGTQEYKAPNLAWMLRTGEATKSTTRDPSKQLA